MTDLNLMVYGTTPQERDIILARNRVAVADELVHLEQEKADRLRYKNSLIADILKRTNTTWTEQQLKNKSITVLERIFDYS